MGWDGMNNKLDYWNKRAYYLIDYAIESITDVQERLSTINEINMSTDSYLFDDEIGMIRGELKGAISIINDVIYNVLDSRLNYK